jgi:predicted transcriptional regulator
LDHKSGRSLGRQREAAGPVSGKSYDTGAASKSGVVVDGPSLSALALQAIGMARHATTNSRRVLEHPARARILEAVRANPGILLTDLRRVLGCSGSTIQHHVGLLERAGHLVSRSEEQRRHLFVNGTDARTQAAMSVVARRSRAMDFLRLVATEPGIMQKEVTDRLSISRKALGEYVADLAACGLLDTKAEGGRRTYHPTTQMVKVLRELDVEPSAAAPRETLADLAPADGGDAADAAGPDRDGLRAEAVPLAR